MSNNLKVTAHIKAGNRLVAQTVYTHLTEPQFLQSLTTSSNQAFRWMDADGIWSKTIVIPIDDVAMWVLEPE